MLVSLSAKGVSNDINDKESILQGLSKTARSASSSSDIGAEKDIFSKYLNSLRHAEGIIPYYTIH